MLESGNALLLVITIMLAVAGVVVAVLMVREIIEIGRNVYASIRDERRFSRSNIVAPDRQVAPFRDRKTAERAIDYLEEEQRE